MARKILLADDSVTAQNMGRKILADAGYDVVTVNNGSAALKRITELKPDLIVLDVYMPGYSGLEVCQRLKDSSETSHIPVLLTVGKLEPFKPEEARRVKADAHIVKPFEASELLTAIMRLEDRVVPQPAESNTDLDTGWKSRLRFPSKKKKEEPEPEREDFATGATFRNFRKGKSQKESDQVLEVKAPPEPASALVPDIPRDITPEELDALSALVAKLDAPLPAQNAAPVAEEARPVEAPAAECAIKTAECAIKTEVGLPAAAAEGKKAEEAKALETPALPAAEMVEPAAAAVDAPALAVEANREVENPVSHVEPATEVAPVGGDAAPVAATVVNTALFAEEPAPVDRDDEPIFASAATAVEPAKEDKAEEKTEGKPAEELKAEEAAPPVAVAVKEQEPTEAEEAAPSDADLAEALRLLTPATGHAGPSQGTLVATGSRWVAEPMTLSPEEAAISLEAEMFHAFTATAGAEIEPVRITGVKAIAAAVENRLAEAEVVASVKAVDEPAAEPGSAEEGSGIHGLVEHGAETTAAETPVVEAPAEVRASVSEPAIPAVERAESEPEKEIKPEKIEAERTSFPEKIAAAEEPAAATFAEAVDRDEIKAAAEQIGEPVDEATAGSRNQDSNSEAGGQEFMGTDGKAKSGKSNWHRIHTAPASAAATGDVVEAAKLAECAVEQAPKAMAAAAEGSGSASVTDARTIASIVDSVMADLRPKIVEEIAKKLAGK
ncbi:MAG: response regulator [Acidobacteriia bacterium]|nr:response regulator [Terriglobia bacterium]